MSKTTRTLLPDSKGVNTPLVVHRCLIAMDPEGVNPSLVVHNPKGHSGASQSLEENYGRIVLERQDVGRPGDIVCDPLRKLDHLVMEIRCLDQQETELERLRKEIHVMKTAEGGQRREPQTFVMNLDLA